MKNLFILFFINITYCCAGQSKNFTVNNQLFILKTKIVKNDWNTKDTIQFLFRVENGSDVKILKFYSFKDVGGDCNNLFWNKEFLEIAGDSLVLTTTYFQETGIDPIPVERKQIYEVNNQGKLILVYNRYRYKDSKDWVVAMCY